jgi:sugar phosphate isomerase/epimerase
MTARGLVERAAALGVRRVQIADNIPLDELPAGELDTLETRAGELEVAIEVGTRGITPSHLLTYLGLARRFRSPVLRVVVDRERHHPSPDEVVDLVRGVVKEFERDNVVLAIENHDRFSAQTIARIIERIGSRHVGVCLDTVNSFGALEGPAVVVAALGPMTVNLHVKEFTIVRASHTMGFSIEGRPAGQGQLNVPWLLDTLRGMGRDPNAIIELWTPPESDVAATIAKEDSWAAQSVEYLRRFIPS